MKRFLVILLAALALATMASVRWQPEPIEERLVRIRAAEAFPDLVDELADEPIEVLATLVDYADDKVLLLKAQAAVLRHPRLAREILPIYGQEPEFREILRTYGEAVLLPIGYFLHNEVRTVAIADSVARRAHEFSDAVSRWWEPGAARVPGERASVDARPAPEGQPASEAHSAPDAHPAPRESSTSEARPTPPEQASRALTPRDRGWYAVHFVRDEGHDFLGQFALDPQGNPQWIQTERVLEGLNALFASGVRSLETKARTGGEIAASDYGWAAVDGLAIVGATALLRAGKAAGAATKATTSARSATLSTRAAAYSSHVAKAARIGVRSARYAKWPAIVATTYLVVRHPSIIGDVLSELADAIGWPRWLVHALGWTALLLPLLFVSWTVWRTLAWFARPASPKPYERLAAAARR